MSLSTLSSYAVYVLYAMSIIAFLNLWRKGEAQETLLGIVTWPFKLAKAWRRDVSQRRLTLLDSLHNDPLERFAYVAENIFMLLSMLALMAVLAILPTTGEAGVFVALVLICLVGFAMYLMALRLNGVMGQLRRYSTVREKLLEDLKDDK